MNYKLLLSVLVLSVILVISGCGLTPGKSAFAGQAVSLGGKQIECATNWHYLPGWNEDAGEYGEGFISKIIPECMDSEGELWCALKTKTIPVYVSGGRENINWKYCDKDRRGRVRTDGCVSGDWYYQWSTEGDAKLTKHRGCTLANDNDYWCAITVENKEVYFPLSGEYGETWEKCGEEKSAALDKLPTLPSSEKEQIDETAAYGKLYAQCVDVYEGCDMKLLNSMLQKSPAFASDFGKFAYNHKEDWASLNINVKDVTSVVNVMYKGITDEQARAFVQLLLVEEVERQTAEFNAQKKALLDPSSGPQLVKKSYDGGTQDFGSNDAKLQSIFDKIMKNQLGSKDWELEHKGEEETDAVALAKEGLAGKSDFFDVMGSCLQAASAWQGVGGGK